jgi:hypothetical protein
MLIRTSKKEVKGWRMVMGQGSRGWGRGEKCKKRQTFYFIFLTGGKARLEKRWRELEYREKSSSYQFPVHYTNASATNASIRLEQAGNAINSDNASGVYIPSHHAR